MKRAFILGSLGFAILAIGFAAGTFFQDARNGYQYRLLEEKEYASPIGTVTWTCFTETVGFSFLDTEKTMITMGNRTIYKAQRDFQENNPRARNIETSSNVIRWEDGDYRYYLKMEEITNGEPSAATNNHPPSQAQ